jgi:methylglutaconyl-CoA hydratase
MQTLTRSTDSRGVLTLTLQRPEVHNAFDALMISELTEALTVAGNSNTVRIVIITGAGKCFSAGADMHWMRSLVDASVEDNHADALRLAKLLRRLNYLSKPTIARINGAAFGGGLGLIAACDITIAAETARFGLTEARLGLAPAVISPYVFRRIGERNARRYFLTGERFDCRRAMDIGLLQQAVAEKDLDPAIEDVIGQLLLNGPEAVMQCKQLVFDVAGHDLAQQKALDEHTAGLIARLRVSAEGQEGLAAFLEKRQPDWVEERQQHKDG